jgi:biopolymer transport protein ExbD
MTVTISKDNRIFLGLDSQVLRAKVFGPENQLHEEIEVDMKALPDLLIRARSTNPRLRTVVKGDKDADYGLAEDVMNILQKTNITRFNLITDLKKD